MGATSAQLPLHPSPLPPRRLSGPPTQRCTRPGLGPEPAPAGPLPRPAPGCPVPGKRPRKETFPSMIVLPLAERVMKILGKCYTTRGYPFGAKFPEKPGRFPGGEGRCWGRRYLPGSTSASSALPPRLPPFPARPPPKPEPENNITRLRPQTYLSPLQCYKKHLN